MESKKQMIKRYVKLTHAMLTLEEAELLFDLAKKSSKKGVIVEIGSYKGGSTTLLAKGSKLSGKSKVYSVDPHNFGLYRTSKRGEDIPTNTLPFLKDNLKKSNTEDWVVPIVKTSEQAVKNWNKPISLLWIDGNHNYEHVKMDFLFWERYLIKGGIIAFHDTCDSKNVARIYGKINANVGPARVVKENIFSSGRFRNIKIVDSITFAEKVLSEEGPLDVSKIFRLKLSIIFNKFYLRIRHPYLTIDRFIGRIGLFIKRYSPKLYFKLKKIKKEIS